MQDCTQLPRMTCTKATNRGLSLDLSSPFTPHASDLRSPEDINLNLYNFDKVDALNCPYVLTSPRSLEACANLGIKPVELLSKTFEEFRDDLPSYTPFDEVKHLYKLFEIQRTSKFVEGKSCRKEVRFGTCSGNGRNSEGIIGESGRKYGCCTGRMLDSDFGGKGN